MTFGFVEQSGGHPSAHSVGGDGAAYNLLLPRMPSEPCDETSSGDNPTTPVAADAEAVLVVEDDADLRHLVVELLYELEYQVFDAPDGTSALKILEQNAQIDLLLSDVVLPGGMLGPDIAAAALRARPDLKVMYMSGYTDGAEVGTIGSDTDIELIRKPFKLADLGHRLRRVLDS